jgi:hypothetical protein
MNSAGAMPHAAAVVSPQMLANAPSKQTQLNRSKSSEVQHGASMLHSECKSLLSAEKDPKLTSSEA